MEVSEKLYGMQAPSIVTGELYTTSETNVDQLYNNARGTLLAQPRHQPR